jgi:hypothetical protein
VALQGPIELIVEMLSYAIVDDEDDLEDNQPCVDFSSQIRLVLRPGVLTQEIVGTLYHHCVQHPWPGEGYEYDNG